MPAARPSAGGAVGSRGQGHRRALWSRRASLVAVLIVGLATAVSMWLSARWSSDPWGPKVGPHLHGVASADGGILLSGHSGAYVVGRDNDRSREAIAVATGFHPLAWAPGSDGVLYAASSDGKLLTFSEGGDTAVRRIGRRVSSVEAFGALEDTMFVVDTSGKVFYSRDAGRSFVERQSPRDLRGNISISRADPQAALGLTGASHAMETLDGGRTWSVLKLKPGGDVVVANPDNWNELALLIEDAVYQSFDHGASWRVINAPPDITVLAFDSDGTLIAAAAFEDQGIVFRRTENDWEAIS